MFATLESKLLVGVIALAVLLSAAGGLVWYGYGWGSDHVQAKWDAQKVKDKLDIEKELQSARDEGYSLAQESITEKQELEQQYARLSTLYASSLRKKVTCPASGEVGDVVLPADLIGSMFIHSAVPASAPGSTPRRADARVR